MYFVTILIPFLSKYIHRRFLVRKIPTSMVSYQIRIHIPRVLSVTILILLLSQHVHHRFSSSKDPRQNGPGTLLQNARGPFRQGLLSSSQLVDQWRAVPASRFFWPFYTPACNDMCSMTIKACLVQECATQHARGPYRLDSY